LKEREKLEFVRNHHRNAFDSINREIGKNWKYRTLEFNIC